MPPPSLREESGSYVLPIIAAVAGVALIVGMVVTMASGGKKAEEPTAAAVAPKSPVTSVMKSVAVSDVKAKAGPATAPVVPNVVSNVVAAALPDVKPSKVGAPATEPTAAVPVAKAPVVEAVTAVATPVKAVVKTAAMVAVEALEGRFTKDVQPVLQKYCYSCHADGKHKGDVSLDKYATLLSVQGDRETWQSVCDQVSAGDMPPEEKPRPSKAEIAQLTSWVKDALSFRDTGPRDPGRVTIHRLNRAEYNNTIRDLVGVDFKPAADFPADDTGYGFDNIADVLSMSPLLAEKYLGAAEQVMDRAIVTDPPRSQVYHFDSSRLKLTGGGETKANDAGAWPLIAAGDLSAQQDVPVAGEYELRIRCYGTKGGTDFPRMTVRLDNAVLRANVEVSAPQDKPLTYMVRTDLKPGTHAVAAAFTNPLPNLADPKKVARKLYVQSIEIEGPRNAEKLPVPPASGVQKKLIFATPQKDGSEADCARKVIAQFASRAFRRPAKDQEVERLLALFGASRKDGDGYEKAIKMSLTAVLVSPHFLFRIEPKPAGATEAVYAIDDYALASRLSYFLWSSMPDEELTSLAAAGKLRQPGVIEQQVKRMTADAKAQAFVANFAGQWLELRLLDDYEPDPRRFPGFTRDLRVAMKTEAELFFQNLMKEDGSVLDLINSNYSYLNGTLARFYGINNVTGEQFRKVALTSDSHRGGVLTMAAVMTVTAMPSRTSPVKRGKYVLEQILGTPPPPPPPDVPALSEKRKDADAASLRVRLEQHRADPTCASCHKRMDPIGFALENFDAIGRWRDKDGAFAIDASGVLPGNKKIAGADDLKKVLLERKDDVVRCLVTKMMTYATGRAAEPGDRATIADVCEDVRKANYRFSSVLMGIVKSDAFQKRRAE